MASVFRMLGVKSRLYQWFIRKQMPTTWWRPRVCWRTSSWMWTNPRNFSIRKPRRLRKSKPIVGQRMHARGHTHLPELDLWHTTHWVCVCVHVRVHACVPLPHSPECSTPADTLLTNTLLCSPAFKCEESAWALGQGLLHFQRALQPDARPRAQAKDQLGASVGWKAGQLQNQLAFF